MACARDSRIGGIIILPYLIFICKRARLFLASWEKFQPLLAVSLMFFTRLCNIYIYIYMEEKYRAKFLYKLYNVP